MCICIMICLERIQLNSAHDIMSVTRKRDDAKQQVQKRETFFAYANFFYLRLLLLYMLNNRFYFFVYMCGDASKVRERERIVEYVPSSFYLPMCVYEPWILLHFCSLCVLCVALCKCVTIALDRCLFFFFSL